MTKSELRARIIEYLERGDGGDLLRSVGDIAVAIGADRTGVQNLVRELVHKGEVFEPIPRRYLRRERRLRTDRRLARAVALTGLERRRASRRAGSRH